MTMEVGHVYVVYTTLTRPPKDKIAICVCGVSDLFLWINTKPRSHGIGQFRLRPSDHPEALTHECNLDCSQVTTFLPHELRASQHRGLISKDLARRIVQFLTDSPPKTLAPRHLKLIVENLSDL